MNTRNRIKLLFAVLIFVLVIVAYFIANNMLHDFNQTGNDWVGISLHSLSMNESQLVNASGARWIRIDCYEEFEIAVVNAKDYDFKFLGILDSWMFNKSSKFTLEEWRDNVTYYVSHYADYVDAWEIWNEPANPAVNQTLLNATLPENMSRIVQFYFSMVNISSPIIRQYDPTAKIVLFGGLNLFSGGDQHLELDKNFSKQLAKLNIEQYGDVLSIHAYPWMDTVQPNIWKNYTDSLEYYKELYPSLEIWVTETGHYTGIEDEKGQAQYLVEALQYFKGKVAKLFWYSLRDNEWEIKIGQHFGLIGNGTPRLAYYELKNELN